MSDLCFERRHESLLSCGRRVPWFALLRRPAFWVVEIREEKMDRLTSVVIAPSGAVLGTGAALFWSSAVRFVRRSW